MALVVGINTYDNLASDKQLKKAVSDARTVAAALKELKFDDVIVGDDLGREAFYVAWQRFLGLVAPGDTAVLFFAGHGVEIKGSNYLIPRDAPKAEKGELVFREGAIAFSGLLEGLDERKPGVALVILDACRDNPFSASGRTIGGTRGLARIDERRGSLVLYSAGIGQVALDSVPNDRASPTPPSPTRWCRS